MSLQRDCAHRFAERHPVAAAEVLEQLSGEESAMFLADEPADVAAQLLGGMAPGAAAECLGALGPQSLGAVLGVMPADTAARLLRRLSAERREAAIKACGPERRSLIERLMDFPEGTVGGVVDPAVIALPSTLRADQARLQIKQRQTSVHHHVYVIDREQRVQGVVHMRDLLQADERTTLSQLMTPAAVQLPATARVNDVASHHVWRRVDALPVLDRVGRLLGILRHRDVRATASVVTHHPMVGTLLNLGELYWLGLTTVLSGPAVRGVQAVETPGGRDVDGR